MVTFHRDIEYIGRMRPDLVSIAADEFQRVGRLVRSGLPTLDRLRGRIDWRGDARDLYERRLTEATDLFDALQAGYTKVGTAIGTYADAQQTARGLVAQGEAAESRLGRLIARIVTTQTVVVQRSRPMHQWNDLRGNSGVTDWLAEFGRRGDIDHVRAQADRLWNEASGFYERARATEQNARTVTGSALRSARQALPDFLADSADARAIIAGTPGLNDEVYQASRDPNARRPGEPTLGLYQVADDPASRMYPDGVTGWFAERLGQEPKELRASEAAILDELNPAEQLTFQQIRDEAFAAADARYPSPDQNDDQNDAFRHTYWNARLTQEFGADWAQRYATAHEAIPGNPAAREGMDLYNNEVGRSIGAAHPESSPDELARYVREAVDGGRAVVLDSSGDLAYSDQVRPEDTGQPSDRTLPGHPQPPNTGS